MTLYLRSKGKLEGIVNDNHLHDLGKFMFAFTIFWAYIGFCQFMLIWYANMPEETLGSKSASPTAGARCPGCCCSGTS